MVNLPIVEKSPNETVSYSFDFNEFLSSTEDAISTWDVGSDEGITLSAPSESAGVVDVFMSGGENKRSYLIAADIVTAAGRVSRKQMLLRVRGAAVTGPFVTGTIDALYVADGYVLPGYVN